MTDETQHHLHFSCATTMDEIPDSTIDLVVTSPPYPMIAMWDECFSGSDPAIAQALSQENGMEAFEAMHRHLDKVWDGVVRTLKPGGFTAINIGDATRSLAGEFACYPNHARITMALIQRGLTPLPEILWRKVSTAPNKFMGSGTLPAGAYVTQEHEYILLFRKGGKRVFKPGMAKETRSRSAIFWEERNRWYSDIWSDISGIRQETGDAHVRQRSAAYPLELPLRLILMYSAQGDTILDPFSGTGTTMQAAMATGRSSVSYETDSAFAPLFDERAKATPSLSKKLCRNRFKAHLKFVRDRLKTRKPIKHMNRVYHVPVVMAQEKALTLTQTNQVIPSGSGFLATHGDYTPREKLETFDISATHAEESQKKSGPAKSQIAP
ncbi:MAG: site-specific DNA-methyltransferase [Desulfobacterales bacterium]|nr:site-specific DNA-methyltransferase [Desulfobacterales bacterium]